MASDIDVSRYWFLRSVSLLARHIGTGLVIFITALLYSFVRRQNRTKLWPCTIRDTGKNFGELLRI